VVAPYGVLCDQIALVAFHSRCDCVPPRATVGGLRASWTRSRHSSVLVEMAWALAWLAKGAATCTGTVDQGGFESESARTSNTQDRAFGVGAIPCVSSMSFAHQVCLSTGSTARPITFTPRRSNSGMILATPLQAKVLRALGVDISGWGKATIARAGRTDPA